MIRHKVGILILFADVLALVSAFLVSVIVTPYIPETMLSTPVSERSTYEIYGHLNYFIALSVIVLFMFHNKRHYRWRIPWWSQVQYVAIMLLIALVVDGFILFSLKQPFSRISVFLSWSCALVFILLGRQIIRITLEQSGNWVFSSVIIGDRETVMDTLHALSSDSYTGCKVHTLILCEDEDSDIDRSLLPPKYRDIMVVHLPAGHESYTNYIKNNPSEFYIIALDAVSEDGRDKIFTLLDRLNTDYIMIPPMSRLSLYGVEPQYFFGHDIMFLRARYKINSPLGRFVKRAVDIMGALCALAILLPFLPIIAYFIRQDGGPVFYAGTRVGKNGRVFKCWKLRTMVLDANEKLEQLLARDMKARAEYEKYCKLRNDPRITKIGRILRKGSIDELPQLLNVVKGDMSLVGPRPILESEREAYGDKLDLYCAVKPGITGLWQVSGRNEATFSQRIHLDKWYINNWSVWHDFVIMFKTVRTVIFPTGAF